MIRLLPLWNRARYVGGVSNSKVRLRLRESAASSAVYVVGDVHGRLDLLLAIEDKIRGFGDLDSWTVLVGDVVDRGPQTRELLDYLIARQEADPRYIVLCGNHEAMMLAALTNRDDAEMWLAEGGAETLQSYGNLRSRRRDLGSEIPEAHANWLAGLPTVFETEHYFVCHAGVRPSVPLDYQADDDLLWLRDSLNSDYSSVKKVVVNGHHVVAEAIISTGRILVDTGAYATGNLSAVRLAGDGPPKLFRVTDADLNRAGKDWPDSSHLIARSKP